MTYSSAAPQLMERLPAVRGRMTENASLGENSWFRVGGNAEILYKPADRDDLSKFLGACPDDIPITVIGVASNMLIRDGGIRGVVIRLGRSFADIEVREDEHRIFAGAAALDVNVATMAARHGIAGLEFYSGIPGTIGGALRMNAGAYQNETVDVLVEAEVMNRDGQIRMYKPDQMDMCYRYNGLPENFIFTGALLQGFAGDPQEIDARIAEIREARSATQPIKARTGGSTFANPDPQDLEAAGLNPEMKTWELIDQAGCRGLMVGGAKMSEKHCNFMINTGTATAEDLESLGEIVRGRVQDKFGIVLRWEIRRLGESKISLDETTKAVGEA